MIYPKDIWLEKKKAGFGSFLLYEGIVKMGGPFAVLMQAIGYFFLAEPGESFGTYFTAGRTWLVFLLNGILFGSIMGSLNWWRNEKAYGGQRAAGEDK